MDTTKVPSSVATVSLLIGLGGANLLYSLFTTGFALSLSAQIMAGLFGFLLICCGIGLFKLKKVSWVGSVVLLGIFIVFQSVVYYALSSSYDQARVLLSLIPAVVCFGVLIYQRRIFVR